MYTHFLFLFVLVLSAAPLILFAAPPTNFKDVVGLLLGYIRLAIPLIFSLAFVVTIWGVVNAWIINGGDTEKVSEGKEIALWGSIGMAVMLSVWGLLAFLRSSFFGI